MEIKLEYSLKNGKRVGEKNMHLITCKVDAEMDYGTGKVKDCHATYKIKKESEGFIFREVNLNHGMGHYPTVRELIIGALVDKYNREYTIHIDDE